MKNKKTKPDYKCLYQSLFHTMHWLQKRLERYPLRDADAGFLLAKYVLAFELDRIQTAEMENRRRAPAPLSYRLCAGPAARWKRRLAVRTAHRAAQAYGLDPDALLEELKQEKTA